MDEATHRRLRCAGVRDGGDGARPAISQTRIDQLVRTKTAATAHAHTNRLAREKSPYLLQHQHNPVDWHAWGEEAFSKARKENKPLFLSIGYSTCIGARDGAGIVRERGHAKFLNEHFVSIKVDREERPDVDKIYMTFVQSTTAREAGL